MSECSCQSCQSACTQKPGWFLPGEIEKVSEHLKIPVQELFDNHLGVDWWESENQEKSIFVLSPAIRNMTPGEEFPGNPIGECVFFENGKCNIHPVKPFECREFIHTDKGNEIFRNRKTIIKNAWEPLQQEITELLGREPETEEYSLDIFSMIFGTR